MAPSLLNITLEISPLSNKWMDIPKKKEWCSIMWLSVKSCILILAKKKHNKQVLEGYS